MWAQSGLGWHLLRSSSGTKGALLATTPWWPANSIAPCYGGRAVLPRKKLQARKRLVPMGPPTPGELP